ncbi:MAG TPA: 3-oxo-tetronate kinase [Pyrinomonadaceae bacterium]|nr:3-oxo-tetronate kinase [Pyrinomonadaceae bacterium]
MESLLFAAVADDDTGASDLAGMLAGQGARTLLVIDLPEPEKLAAWARGYDAVVMAEATRNVAPALAYERTRAAVRLLRAMRPRLFQVKYCSTFDSTPEGNIGPSIDAAMDELGEEFTVALPALPVNGRTTYQGYHFVHGRLLSDSPMRHHPLTPMTNPDLVDLLGRQTRRRVGLAPYAGIESGGDGLKEHFAALRREGVNVAVVDCLHEAHVETICRACDGLRLLTGGSAFGAWLPRLWRERGLLKDERPPPPPLPSGGNGAGCLIVAGSCSEATRRQNEWFAARGAFVRRLTAEELLSGSLDAAALAGEVRAELGAGRHCLLTTSAAADEVRGVQRWGEARGLSVPALGEKLSYALAGVVREMVEGGAVGGLVVAGGETSGAVCRRLELGALRVGRNIEPGVPLCFAVGGRPLPLVLKSGNFGGEDFYARAIDAVSRRGEFFDF